MDQLFEVVKTVWKVPFVSELVTGLVTLLVTHFLDNRKMKKQQSIDYRNDVMKKKTEAITEVRKVVLELKEYEVFGAGIINTEPHVEKNAFYPSMMTSKESFLDYSIRFSDARRKWEPYLSLKVAARLCAFEQYLLYLASVVAKYPANDRVQLIGSVAIVDIQKWQKKTDQCLVNEMNSPSYKVFSENGNRWNRNVKRQRRSLIYKSKLVAAFDIPVEKD